MADVMVDSIIDTLKVRRDETEEEFLFYPRSKTTAITNNKGENLDDIINRIDVRVSDSVFNDVYAETSINMNRKENTAIGRNSVALGSNCEASGNESFASGSNCTASQWCAHAEGEQTVASGYYSHAEGMNSKATGSYSHAEGDFCTASGNASHAEGNGSEAIGFASHAENNNCNAIGDESHAEGDGTVSTGRCSHAEGEDTQSIGIGSHAEGYNTKSEGQYSHAEGQSTTSRQYGSHAEGYGTQANASYSHAEGYNTQANGMYAHAEGNTCIAKNEATHVEGYHTEANSSYAHAEGEYTIANGYGSHAEGYYNIATGQYQHVQGKFNFEDTENKYAHIVGGGTYGERKNIHTLDWEGNAVFAGNVTNGNGATINGIETTTDNVVCNKIDTPIVVNSIIGTFNQVTTKGNQLYNFADRTETQNGLTIVFKDGIGTITGTPTIESGTYYDIYFDPVDISILVDGIWYQGQGNCKFKVTNVNGTTTDVSSFQYNSSTISEIIPHVTSTYYREQEGGIILEPILGIGYCSWETYTGGLPSPNPLYRQTLEYPIFTKVSVSTESESCSATSPIQIMLCGMNEVYDSIKPNELNKNIYELTKKFERIVLTGTEDIILDSTTGCFLYSPTIDAKGGSINIASDNYKYFETDTYTTNYGIFILESGEIGIKHDDFSTVDEYKAWLVDNNVTIIYERETEEVIDLDETFINELHNLRIFIGENTIETDSETIHPIIEFDYATSKMAKYVMEAPTSSNGSSGVNVPTKISQLRNDVGFITIDDVPKNVSDFNNDAGYLTLDTLPEFPSSGDTSNTVPTTRKIADIDLVDDITTDELKDALSVPTKLSDLENDTNYITQEDIGDIELNNIVPSARTIAGIDLVDDITVEELKEVLEIDVIQSDILDLENLINNGNTENIDGQSVFAKDILFASEQETGVGEGTYTLNFDNAMCDSVYEYDFIIASGWGYVSDGTYEQRLTTVIPKDLLEKHATSFEYSDFLINASIPDTDRRIMFSFVDGTTLKIVTARTSQLTHIYGIKFKTINKEEWDFVLESIEEFKNNEIPTKVSQLENDAGYITQDDITEAGSVSAGEIKSWLYDTSGEEVIVGVYDGKPLYQKIFVFNNVYGRVDADISLDNVERAFLTEAIATNKEGNKLPLPYIHPDSITWAITIFINNDYTKIGFRVGEAFSQDSPLSNIIVTIRYTKTTDAEGSGNDLKPYGIYDAKLDNFEDRLSVIETNFTALSSILTTETF